MIDTASFMMEDGKLIAVERIEGMNDNMVKSHYHEYFELYYLEYGKRNHMVEENLYRMESGEFVIFPPYIVHHSYGDNDVSFKRLLLYFRPEAVMIPDLLDMLRTTAGIYHLNSKESQVVHTTLKYILNEQSQNDLYAEDDMKMLLNHLLIQITRHTGEIVKPEKESRINNIIHYIHQHYTENISLQELASIFFISPYYLCREFKRYTNSTIVQYINSIRIIQSQRLLMETDKSVTEISSIVGFSNITHFERVFKSVTGISPSKCKKQYIDHLN